MCVEPPEKGRHERGAVGASAHGHQNEGFPQAPRPRGIAARSRRIDRTVDVAGVAHLGRDVVREPVLADEVEYVRAAVDEDVVVVAAERVNRCPGVVQASMTSAGRR